MSDSADILLEARQIDKCFGGVQALSDVSLHIRRGEIYGLIGPNGAGKTTFFNCLTGLYTPNKGDFLLAGQRLQKNAPHRAAALGIARTFQNIRLFQSMTVLENAMIGCHVRTHGGVIGAVLRGQQTRAEEAAIRQQAYTCLQYAGIEAHAEKAAHALAYGDQRRLEIARALATQPCLLCLDEPAAGMNATETSVLRKLVEKIRADGVTVLLIEHDVKFVMQLCDRVAVLDYGRLLIEDVPQRVRDDPRVIAAYLGMAT